MTNGSGFGSDPVIFVIDLQASGAKKKPFSAKFSSIIFLRYVPVHLHSFSKKKRYKKVTKQ
jgi:hypothetical protein